MAELWEQARGHVVVAGVVQGGDEAIDRARRHVQIAAALEDQRWHRHAACEVRRIGGDERDAATLESAP